jgi:hypothetical protein
MRNWLGTGVLLGTLALAACGGGGGGEPGIATSPAPTAEAMLLPFVTSTGVLKTVDPLNPAVTPVTVDSGLQTSSTLGYVSYLFGTYDGVTNALADGHVPLMLYLKGGQVFRLDLARGASQVPVRVSSITDACRFEFGGFDFASLASSRVVVPSPRTTAPRSYRSWRTRSRPDRAFP